MLTLTPEHPLAIDAAQIRAARVEAAQIAEQRRAARGTTSETDGIIGQFCALFSVEYMLTECGYTQRRNSHDWQSTHQTSGSFATRDYGDYWVSHSGSDATAGLGIVTKNGDRTGDAFALLCHFKHGGNEKAAYAEAVALVSLPRIRQDPPTEGIHIPLGDLLLAAQLGAGPGDYMPRGMTQEPVRPAAAQAAPARTSHFFPATDFANETAPVRPWHVPDIIPGETVTLMGGDGGTGKSLMALQLAVSTALGRQWLGLKVTAGRAVYISAEDDRDELHRRLRGICAAGFTSLADLGGLTLRSLAGEDALLAHLDRAGVLTPTALLTELDATMAENAPTLLVLDTLADLFPGDENNRAQARQFIGLLRGLAIRHRAAVVLLAHPSKSGMGQGGDGTSGSTAWNNSVRSRLYLDRIKEDHHEPDPDARRLTVHKANYGRTGLEIGVRWRAGVFEPLPGETSLDRMANGAKAEAVFMKLLREFTTLGRNVNHAGSQTYAPKMFADHSGSDGVTKRAFKTAMDGLLASGKIEIVKSGPPSRPTSQLLETLNNEK